MKALTILASAAVFGNAKTGDAPIVTIPLYYRLFIFIIFWGVVGVVATILKKALEHFAGSATPKDTDKSDEDPRS